MSSVNSEGLLRIGILGYSDIARRKFIPALLQSRQACLAALASRDLNAAASIMQDLPVDLMSYDELVRNSDIDLVYISLPNHLHEEWSVRALEAGMHVICEKPLGLSAQSVKRMLAAADKNGKLLFENLMYLQHQLMSAVQVRVEQKQLGRILSLRCVFTIPEPPVGNFRLDRAMGGGAYHDLNRYPFSAALCLLRGRHHKLLRGEAQDLDGLNRCLAGESLTEAGERFLFEVAFGKPYQSFYEITGERGTIRVERAFTTPPDMEARVEVRVEGRDESFCVPPQDHFLSTIEHVCGLIRQGNWDGVHDRSRRLAELAEQINTECRRN